MNHSFGGYMSIFGDIVNKIFGHAKPDQPALAAEPAVDPALAAAGPATPALSDVDVESVMDQLVADSGQTLSWRASIVDTMKALGMDSSLERRKQLAHELNFDGDTNDSAKMNVWLHKQLMKALAANGGKLPATLTA